MPPAGCVFEELKVSCPDQWTPGPQRRSVVTLEENMEVVNELEKENSQWVFVLKKWVVVKHSMSQRCHC